MTITETKTTNMTAIRRFWEGFNSHTYCLTDEVERWIGAKVIYGEPLAPVE